MIKKKSNSRKSGPPSEKSGAILKAAKRLFLGRRFDRVLMDDIARAAGCAKGTLYLYFRTKEDLYLGILTRDFDLFHRRLESSLRNPGTAWEALGKITALLFRFLKGNYDFFVLSRQAEIHLRRKHRELLREQHNRIIQMLAGLVGKGMEEGVIQNGDPEGYAHILLGMIFASAHPASRPAAQTPKLVLRIFAEGIRSRPDRGPTRTSSRTGSPRRPG
ncbi:MAG TPA: TetR/AcrR family transcriptional regulator [bacterium]|nr:TetR/AcrR family transcriptional regulator [bacterium]HNS48912.1 TetR/AcrR family transcriptional regulator [bacterium]